MSRARVSYFPMMRSFLVVNPWRLLAGLGALALLMVPAYLFLIRDPVDAGVQRAVVVDTNVPGDLDVGLELGDKAPDFEASTPQGERVRLSDFEGRPLVVNFWATWCTSCLSEMPDLKALQAELGGDAFGVLAVNAGESRAQAQEFIDFLEAPFVYALDPGLVLSDAYGVRGLPLSVFLDSKGVVRGVYRGHALPDVLDTFITAAIEAEPPGEVPSVLRTVSTIYRPRTVMVSTTGPGNLTFASRALRCDFSFCADDVVVAALTQQSGIKAATFTPGADGERRLTIDFDDTIVTDGDVASALRGILEGLDDPLYDLPIEMVFTPD